MKRIKIIILHGRKCRTTIAQKKVVFLAHVIFLSKLLLLFISLSVYAELVILFHFIFLICRSCCFQLFHLPPIVKWMRMITSDEINKNNNFCMTGRWHKGEQQLLDQMNVKRTRIITISFAFTHKPKVHSRSFLLTVTIASY